MMAWQDIHPSSWALLQRARLEDRLPHALLMTGPAGIGKLAFAEVLASSLLCDQPESDGLACGVCTSCTWHASGNHPDFRRIRPEAYEADWPVDDDLRPTSKTERKKSEQIRIDQIRALESFVQVGSHRGRRVILIEPAEAMNEATANALLKSLEEPPGGVHFLLVSHAAERLLPTVRSRTRTIPMRVPERSTSLAQLTANGIPVPQASLWLNRCVGALRFALAFARVTHKDTAATEEAVAEVAILEALLAHLPLGERLDTLALARSCETLIKGDQSGLRLAQVIDWLQRWILDLQLVRLGSTPRTFPELQPQIERLAARVDDAALSALPERLLEARRLCAHPLNIRLFLESVFSQYISLYAAGD